MSETILKRTEEVTIAIAKDDLVIGEPIPFSVYDTANNLLLRKGFVISSDRQIGTLLSKGVRRRVNESEVDEVEGARFGATGKFYVFELVEILLARLQEAYNLLDGPDVRYFPFKICQLALDIQSVCMDNPDAVLAAMQLDVDGDYNLIHPLHTAVLCELIGKRMGLAQMSRLSLVAAAASHDIGLRKIYWDLSHNKGPLSDHLQAQVQDHPARAYQELIKAGVTDDIWLNSVQHHHERIDGSGYPHGLTNELLHITTRILAISDVYSAMIRPRPYRDAIKAQKAIMSLQNKKESLLDNDLAHVFLLELGDYPPGSFVRLRNFEVAIVVARGEDIKKPKLVAVFDAKGEPLPYPKERDFDEVGILGMMPNKMFVDRPINLTELWPMMHPISVS